MPCWPLARSKRRMPKLAAVALDRAHHLLGVLVVRTGAAACAVGMMWSTVATVRSGSAPGASARAASAKACGLVTSWIRCRPMKSCVCPLGSSRTVCASHTLSRRLFLRGPRAHGPARIALPSARGVCSARMELLHTAHVPRRRGSLPDDPRAPRLGRRARTTCSGSRRFCTAARRWWCVRRDRSPSRSSRACSATAGSRSAPAARRIRRSSRAARSCCAASSTRCCARYPVNPRKLVVLGFSQGGVMAYDLVLREPERFAGLVALSSWLPDGAGGVASRGGPSSRSCPSSWCTAARTR